MFDLIFFTVIVNNMYMYILANFFLKFGIFRLLYPLKLGSLVFTIDNSVLYHGRPDNFFVAGGGGEPKKAPIATEKAPHIKKK